MLWVKSFHIIFMVTWFAGLFYLPRLFIYHLQTRDHEGQERFRVMEKKLLIITTIGGAGTVILGFWLLTVYFPQLISERWMIIKLFLVLGLLCYHAWLWLISREFAHGRPTLSDKALRVINEIPAIFLISIIILVEIRP